MDTDVVSVLSGGTQNFLLNAGPAHAGEVYLLLGNFAGTNPGIRFGAELLPLKPDAYFAHTLQNPNAPPLGGSLGILNVNAGLITLGSNPMPTIFKS